MSRVRKTENHFGDLDSLKIRSFYPPSQKLPWSTGANHPGKIQNFVRLCLVQQWLTWGDDNLRSLTRTLVPGDSLGGTQSACFRHIIRLPQFPYVRCWAGEGAEEGRCLRNLFYWTFRMNGYTGTQLLTSPHPVYFPKRRVHSRGLRRCKYWSCLACRTAV